MIRKTGAALVVVIFFCVLLLSGCETSKVLAKSLTQGLAEGLSKDSTTFWDKACKADAWLQENLW